jgi:hypothetical protein
MRRLKAVIYHDTLIRLIGESCRNLVVLYTKIAPSSATKNAEEQNAEGFDVRVRSATLDGDEIGPRSNNKIVFCYYLDWTEK